MAHNKKNDEETHYKAAFCKWTSLRSFGESHILKVSYFSLAAVPLIAKNVIKLGIEGFPLYLKLIFFSSLLISIGNVFYSVFCPKLIKRFDSPNDMYRANLEIYKLRKITNISDGFTGNYEHCIQGFRKNNHNACWARFTCFICLVGGLLLLFFLILERAYWVYAV
jgi:hypothetical protein